MTFPCVEPGLKIYLYIASVRSASVTPVACHSVQLKHTCPDLKSLNGLLPTVWAMRSKRDVLPSPIVPLPLAPFFSVLGTPSRYLFQCLQTSKAIRMLDQLLDGHQDCCMWPSQNLTMPPQRRTQCTQRWSNPIGINWSCHTDSTQARASLKIWWWSKESWQWGQHSWYAHQTFTKNCFYQTSERNGRICNLQW